MAMDVIVEEAALVSGTVTPRELTMSGLQPILELAIELRAVWPDLLAGPMRLAIHKFACILRTLSMGVIGPFAMRLIVFPLTFINISFGELELPVPMGLVVHPGALIARAIAMNLDPLSVPAAIQPLAGVSGAVGVLVLPHLHVVVPRAVCSLLYFQRNLTHLVNADAASSLASSLDSNVNVGGEAASCLSSAEGETAAVGDGFLPTGRGPAPPGFWSRLVSARPLNFWTRSAAGASQQPMVDMVAAA
eukprot:CAMPEP_0115652404 /NCGR_PEP_ID=MMETSP0272-20121206/42048_1 /TAXON_ID=71861 /ORGANISM="Scrippsiella trochoidea, Strain CCMP3099" /LENGTH=247 /DNA_ID=CAMNT_0003090201 /DNA_START=364 /DNA_END=1108 /DNA_ORIENTATION=-